MKGKVFSSSDNIYQDQAKILFNYYQQAAENIVREEERIEGEIENLKAERAAIENKISKLWFWFLTIILFFIYFIKKSQYTKRIAMIDATIEEFQKLHREIFRDYKVTKLGVAYVPVANQIKYDDKSFIVDYTGSTPNSDVVLQVSRQNDLLIDTIGRLEKQSAVAPIVESSDEIETIATDDYSTSIQEINQHDYLGGLERSLRTISFCMGDLETSSVSLPLIANNSKQLNFLREFATKDVPVDAPVVNAFNIEKYDESINMFQELNKLKDSLSTKTQQFEDVLKQLMTNMASSVQRISTLKVASVDKVVMESNKMLINILKAPYNHYSPQLEYEEIERIKNENFDYSEDVQSYEPFKLRPSSRVKFNLLTGMWTSEDGNITNMPFGVHQIHEEIVAPVVQNLMAETRIERLKIYNHIKDQKMSYLNKWHQDTDAFYRANRAESSDIINLMQESLREYVAAYNTLISLEKTMGSMKDSGDLSAAEVKVVDNSVDTITAFELQSQQFQKAQNDFEEYMERLKEDIDLKAEKFGYVEYYDAKLRDGYSNEVAVASSQIHSLEDRRKSLASVNPLFAKTSMLPPEPNIEDITYEHIAINLPAVAQNALDELNNRESVNDLSDFVPFAEPVAQSPSSVHAEPTEEPKIETDEQAPIFEEQTAPKIAESPVAEQTPTVEETPVEETPVEESPIFVEQSPVVEQSTPSTFDLSNDPIFGNAATATTNEPAAEFDLSNDPIFGNAATAAANSEPQTVVEEPTTPANGGRVSIENFSDMSNEDIMRVMDSLNIPYNRFDFNRAEAIQVVIKSINK